MKLLSLILTGLLLTTSAWADDVDKETEILKTAITYMVVHSEGHYGDTSIDNIESWLNNANILSHREAKRNYVEFNANRNLMYVEIETDDSVYDVAVVSMRKDGSVATSMMFIDFGERTLADITPENKGKAIGLVKAKTKKIFKALWGTGHSNVQTQCMIEDYINGKVECSVSDEYDGGDWSVGVVVRWSINKHPNGYLGILPLELNIIEH